MRALAALDPEALALLDALGAVRFLTGPQAGALAGPAAAGALRALSRAGLTQALPYRESALARLQGVWTLTGLGARAAVARASHRAGEGGLADPDLRRRARRLAADALSPLFMAHALRITDLYLAVRGAARAPFTWLSGDEARVAFRSFASPEGRGLLVPDAIVAPADLGYGEDPLALGGAAIEVDRATMGRRAIERKLLRYRERIADRGPFGPILFVADEPDRRRQLERWLGEARLEGAACDLETAARLAAAALERAPTPTAGR